MSWYNRPHELRGGNVDPATIPQPDPGVVVDYGFGWPDLAIWFVFVVAVWVWVAWMVL